VNILSVVTRTRSVSILGDSPAFRNMVSLRMFDRAHVVAGPTDRVPDVGRQPSRVSNASEKACMMRLPHFAPGLSAQAFQDFFVTPRRFWHRPCISVQRADKMLTNL
jgi:hypothetical protein